MNNSDPIVDEVRRIRDAHAAKFNYDPEAIFQDIKDREKRSGREFVSYADESPRRDLEGAPRVPQSDAKTIIEEQVVAELPVDLRNLYLEVRTRVKAFGADVETYATAKNLVFRAGWVFAEIKPKKMSLRFLIRPEGFNIRENTSTDVNGIIVTRVPDTHGWTVTHKFEVDAKSPLDEVVKLLRRSYDAVHKEL